MGWTVWHVRHGKSGGNVSVTLKVSTCPLDDEIKESDAEYLDVQQFIVDIVLSQLYSFAVVL